MINVRASFRITQWNGPRFVNRVPQILAAYGQELDSELQTSIQTAQFAWPRTTRRRNRQTVSSPRDIVDLGGFLRSQERRTSGRNRLAFTWNPRSPGGFTYGGLLYTGYVTRSGTVMPGRDWMSPALRRLPMVAFFRQRWQ